MENDLLLYGAIGWDVNALDTVREVYKAKGKPLSVRVNSPGGYVWEGLAIANAIKQHANADTYVDGLAASMGSVIFLAGKRRTMASGTRLMIHNPTSFAGGESGDLRKEADVLDGISADMALMYSEVTGGKVTVEQAKEMMDAETWLSPEEAVEYGFAHGIDGKATAFAKIPETMKYRNAPKEVALSTEENNPEPSLLDRMMAKLTGTEQMRADLAKMETALAESVQRTMQAESDRDSARAELETTKAAHVAALEGARIEGAQANEAARLKGSAPDPLAHVEEDLEATTTHTAHWDALRAAGKHTEAGEYKSKHRTAILEGR